MMFTVLFSARVCIRGHQLITRQALSLTRTLHPNTFQPPPPSLKWSRFLTTPPATPTPVYTGPLANTVRILKWFSVTTAALTVSFSPILVFLGNPSTPMLARATLSVVVLTVGVSTTLLLHWFMKGYVSRLYYEKESGQVKAITYDMIGREKETTFHLSQATPPFGVATLSTFQAKGQAYFLHADLFDDVQLLQQLAGPEVLFGERGSRQ